MKLFALALFTSAVYAADWQPQAQQQYYKAPQPQYYKPIQPMYVKKAPAQYGRDYNYTAHDPYRHQGTRIPYVPANLSKAVYAQCHDWVHFYMTLFMGQLPGHAIELKGEITDDFGQTAEHTYMFRITQWGSDDERTSNEGVPSGCPNLGGTFNPLANEEYLETETRGTIEDVTIPETFTSPYKVIFKKPLLQNLGGPNSIIGRGIEMSFEYDIGEDDPVIFKSCCPIVLMKPPTPDPTAPPSYLPHYHPAQYYTYGHGHNYGARKW